MPAPELGAEPAQVRRLGRVLRWLGAVAAGVGAAEFAAFVVLRDPALGAGTLVVLGLVGLLWAADALLRRGRVVAAVYAVGAGILGAAVLYVLALPGSPAVALVPFLVTAIAMSYLDGPGLRPLLVAAWAVGTFAVGLNMLFPATAVLPGWSAPAFRLTAFAAASGAGLLVLWQFRERLGEHLARARAAHAELQEAHERLRGLDAMKTRFFNAAAHELRTPLTPILVQLHLLRTGKAGPLNARQARALGIVERNMARLNGLVEDVLDVTRLQAGRLPLARKECELSHLVAEAVESFHDVAAQAGVALELRVASGLRVHADPRRLTQVLFNLLDNALKFTPPGGAVTIEARPGEGGCSVTVRDTGAGLRPEDIPRLFQPFSQVHEATPRGAPHGAGLGLFICRGIVEAHRGRIWAVSPGPGRGAAFSFMLPPAAPAEADGGLSPRAPSGTPRAPA